MKNRFQIDGEEYDTLSLTEGGRELVGRLTFVQLSLHELKNQLALYSKAKNAYIQDLKSEIVQGRAGVNFGDLFSDD